MINRVLSRTRFCFIPQSVQVIIGKLENVLINDKNSLSNNWLRMYASNNSITYSSVIFFVFEL